MAQELSAGNVALALLANTLATGTALVSCLVRLQATLLFRWLVPGLHAQAKKVVLPHSDHQDV
jgi:hypothetical protein